jgi:peptidoglycan hydrolase CwlO-like protein
MLTGKLKEKQLILEHIKMLDNFVKCGFGVSEDELNRLTKEREKIQKEVKTIESEIDMVKTNMELYNECFNNDECTVTKDEDEIDKFWNEFINNSNWKAYRINQISKY